MSKKPTADNPHGLFETEEEIEEELQEVLVYLRKAENALIKVWFSDENKPKDELHKRLKMISQAAVEHAGNVEECFLKLIDISTSANELIEKGTEEDAQ